MSLEYPLTLLGGDAMDALQGTSGDPSDSNRFVTNQDPRLTGSDFKGFWDASLNSPTLSDTNGTIGHTYEVSVAGVQDLGSGDIAFSVGDWVYFNGANWAKRGGSNYAQTVVVAKSGGDFTSVKAAIDSITDASQAKPYVVNVHPGQYIESPFTMKPFVEVVGVGDYFSIFLITNNPNANFITGAPASLISNMIILGPTGTGFAAVDYTAESTTAMIVKNVLFGAGYYCVHCHPATAYGQVFAIQTGFNYSGTTCNTMYRVSGYGTMTCQSAVAEASTADAIINGFVVDGPNASMVISAGYCNLPGTNTTALTLDNGARVNTPGLTVAEATTGIKIGPGGNSVLRAHQCSLNDDNVTNHIDCATNTADISFAGKAQYDKLNIPTGTKTAIYFGESNHDDASGLMVFGELWLGDPQGVFPLSKFAQAYTTTGAYEGGGLSNGTGLSINVEAGKGFVVSSGRMVPIEWDAANVPVSANQSGGYIAVDATGAIVIKATHPGYDEILLGSFVSNATDVLGTAQHSPWIPQNIHRFFDYTKDVIGPINVSGCAVTKNGATSRSVIVDSGVYYIHDVKVNSFASATPAVFNYWYRDGAGDWTITTSNTLINNANYDDGSGTLASLTTGYFRRDALYITTNETSSQFHVVMGQEEFDESTAALANPVPPDFLRNDGLRAAAIVIGEGNSDITIIIDERPKLGQLGSGQTSVSDHGELSGLGDDDHTQYQLRSEAGAANGYVPLNASTKIDSTYIDTADAVPSEAKVAGGLVGTSDQLAREDHGHSVPVGVPSTIGASNAEGVSENLARQDHIHAHGNQAGGALHALATNTTPGFMSDADKALLEGLTTSDVFDVIWAEDNSGMSTTDNGGREWSFGNGSTGTCNIILPYNGSIKKAFLHAESPGTSASFDIMVNDVSAGTASFSANGVVTLTTPIAVFEGDSVGFQTTAVVGSWNDVRIGVGIAQELTGFKGEKGDPGVPGAGSDLAVQLNDATVGAVTEILNFEGSGVQTVVDEGGNKTTVTIQGTPGLAIQSNDSAVGTTTEILNFEGNAVTSVVDEGSNKTTATFNVTATNVNNAGAVMNSDTSTAAMSFVNDANTTTTNLWSADKIQQEIDDGIILLTSLNALKFRYYADQLDYPRSSDWAVNSGAPSARDATYPALTVRRFDDSAVEGVGFSTVFPLLVTDMLIRIKSKAITAPGAAAGVVWRLYWRKFPDNAAPTAWSSLILPAQTIPANTNVQYYVYTAPLTAWGITAGDFTQFELVREATNGSDTLVGDVALLSIELEYS